MRFLQALDHFDSSNGHDPSITVVDGQSLPAELVYARRMTEWLHRMYPQASEALQLAARSQHICRWMIPRNSYPMDRAGYHRWRTALYSFHADTAEKILRDVGYEDATISRVRSLLKKERLKADAESQALEDVACLVFLQFEFADFAPRHEEEKVIGILKRTWAKMSPVGHQAALSLKLCDATTNLIKKALE